MNRLRAVVHIGPMKTGTTAMAAFLSRSSRAGNLPVGFIYPTDDLWWPRDGLIVKHHALTSAGMSKDKTSGRNQQRRNRSDVLVRLDSLAAAVRATATTDTTVFFIAEGVSRHAKPELLTEELLKRFDEVNYCLVARGQVFAHTSAHSHKIKGPAVGKRRSWSDFARRLIRRIRAERRYDYARLYARWGQLDRARLVVVPFFERDIASFDLIDRVLEATDSPIPPREAGIDGKRIHPVLDARSLRLLRALKWMINFTRILPTVNKKLVARFESEKGAAQIRARDGVEDFQAWGLSPRRQEALRRTYAPSNERFAAQLGAARDEPLWVEWFEQQRPRRGTPAR